MTESLKGSDISAQGRVKEGTTETSLARKQDLTTKRKFIKVAMINANDIFTTIIQSKDN